MNARRHGRCWLVVMWVTAMLVPAGVVGQEPSTPPAPVSADKMPTGLHLAPAAAPPATEPRPFWVAGVVLTPTQRSALLVALDERGRDVGTVTLKPGESYEDYRVSTIENDRVVFDRNGVVVTVVVGRPGGGAGGQPNTPPRAFFIPGSETPTPDSSAGRPEFRRRGEAARRAPVDGADHPAPDPEALRKILEALSGNPTFQQRIQEIAPAPQ